MNAITPHDEKFLAALRESPEVQKIAADADAREIAARQKIIADIAALDAKAEKVFPALEKAVQTAIAGVREAEKALRAANNRLNAANYAKTGASFDIQAERQRLEVLLLAGTDEKQFAAFQSAMLDELDKTRKQHEGGYVRVTKRVTGRSEEWGYNNAPSVNARLSAIRAAMEESDRLRLAADQSKVAARLLELRGSLPIVEPAVLPAGAGR